MPPPPKVMRNGARTTIISENKVAAADFILMIVGIDNITPGTSTSASLSVGGMRPYVQDLLLGLPGLFPDWQFKFFTPPWNEPFEIRDPNVEVVLCPGAVKSRPGRVWFEQVRLPGIIARENIGIWLGTCNYLPLRIRCRTLLLIQSHQFFTNPEAFGRLRGAWLRGIVRRSVRKADHVGVQCHDAKRTLLKYLKVPPDSVSVIYNRLVDLEPANPAPANLEPANDTSPGIPRPYLLYISGLYPFKNHARLIAAFARIRPEFPGLALLLAGGGSSGQLRGMAASYGLENDVLFLGRVPQSAIPGLYRNARASVFPSLEETFGLPVLEAMSLDCPVVTSNRSSMAEVAGDAAVLVDPQSVEAIAGGLRRILTDPDLRQDLIRKGHQRCAFFTRENTVASLAAALGDLSTACVLH